MSRDAVPTSDPRAATLESTSLAPEDSLEARVARAVALFQQGLDALGITDAALSAAQVRRAVKFKKGGEPMVALLALLSARYQVEVPSRATATMTATLAQARALEPVRAILGEASKVVDSFYFGCRSETWATATSLYSMLKKGGAREPTLAEAIAPAYAFFANRHPSVTANAISPATRKAKKMKARAEKRRQKLAKQMAALDAALGAPGGGPTTP